MPKNQRDLLQAVAEKAPAWVSLVDVAEALDRPTQGVAMTAGRLIRGGVLERARFAGHVHYRQAGER